MNDNRILGIRSREENDNEEHLSQRQRLSNDSHEDQVYIIEKNGGVYEAEHVIRRLIECGDTRHYQTHIRDSVDCLKMKDSKGSKKKAYALATVTGTSGGIPDSLVKLGPHLYNLARHFIVRKTIVSPKMHFSVIMKCLMKFVCGFKRIISPQWFNLFTLKVWESLQRFCTAIKNDRMTFFFQVLNSNGDKLICGALANISLFHTTQPLIGRKATIGDPDQRQMFSISKRFFETPDQTIHALSTSLNPPVQWLEQFFEDIDEIVRQLNGSLEALVSGLRDARALFLESEAFSNLRNNNDKIFDLLQVIEVVGNIPTGLSVGSIDFDLRIVANKVSRVINRWREIKEIVASAPSSGDARLKISATQKQTFANDPKISTLLGTTFDAVLRHFDALNTLMWNSEMHILFLGFRQQFGGRLHVDLWRGVNDVAGPTQMFDKGTKEFLQLFTADYVGCIYKLMTHFLFNRPVSTTTKVKEMLEIVSDGDTIHYIQLAQFQLEKAFDLNPHAINLYADRNFKYLRMFCKCFHEDWNEETDSTSAQEKVTVSTALTGWDDEILEGDEFAF